MEARFREVVQALKSTESDIVYSEGGTEKDEKGQKSKPPKSRPYGAVVQEIDNSEILSAARAVPCIEVIDGAAPEKARKAFGPFYPDQSDQLTALLKALRKREPFLVALNDAGLVSVYRRARK